VSCKQSSQRKRGVPKGTGGRWPFALFAFGGSFLNCDSATDDPFCVQKQNKTVQQFQTSRPKQSSSERPGKAKRNDVAFRISLPWFGARSVAIYLAKTMRWEKHHRSKQCPVPSEDQDEPLGRGRKKRKPSRIRRHRRRITRKEPPHVGQPVESSRRLQLESQGQNAADTGGTIARLVAVAFPVRAPPRRAGVSTPMRAATNH